MTDYEDYEAAIHAWFDRLDGYQQQSGAAHLTDEALAATGPIPPLPKFESPLDTVMARAQFAAIRDAKGKSMVRTARVTSASARDSGDTNEEQRQMSRAEFWSDVVENLTSR